MLVPAEIHIVVVVIGRFDVQPKPSSAEGQRSENVPFPVSESERDIGASSRRPIAFRGAPLAVHGMECIGSEGA